MLTDAEALALAEDPAPDLAGLCMDARARRDATHGVIVTYSPKVFIPLTLGNIFITGAVLAWRG